MARRLSSHGVYETRYHIVWIVKYRRKILNPGLQGYLRKLFPKVIKELPGVEIEVVGMEKDHIHIIAIIPPRYSVSSVVGRIKSQTGSKIRKRFSWLKKVFWRESIVWSPGYFVSTVGVDERTIKQYVRFQGKKDSGQIKMNQIHLDLY